LASSRVPLRISMVTSGAVNQRASVRAGSIVDHIVPLKRRGPDEPSNMRIGGPGTAMGADWLPAFRWCTGCGIAGGVSAAVGAFPPPTP
jgi:hypothetical protein